MNLIFSKKADKDYQKLPLKLQEKADKQLAFLLQNYQHPSLRTRKMAGEFFEGRIDYHYRFTFYVEKEQIIIMSIGPHDKGLGKK